MLTGLLTTYAYDDLHRLTTLTQADPDGAGPLTSPVTTYAYDAVGNRTKVTDPLGRETVYAYDELDRLVTETWLDGMTTINTLTFTYDAAGNMLTADDDFSSYALEYDNLYRVIESDNSGTTGVPNVVLDYEYDAVGNRLSVSDGTGVSVGGAHVWRSD